MDFKIAFNLKVILGNLNKIKANPNVLYRLNYAIARLEDTIALIDQEKKIEKQKHLKISKELEAFMTRVQAFSKN